MTIQAKILHDGSAIVTWVNGRTGATLTSDMKRSTVLRFASGPCTNDPRGCGLCLPCTLKEAIATEEEVP